MWSLFVYPNCYLKNLLFLTKNENEWKERKFRRRKKIKKSKFYNNKKVTMIDDIDINKILASKEEPYGTKS